jgi:cytochrome c oxidase subunit 3
MSQITIEYSQPATSPGRVGIWIFLASEIMFFMGLLGSYALFRFAEPTLFASQKGVMNKWIGGIDTLVLIASSFTMAMSVAAAANGNRRKLIACLTATIVLAAGFLAIKGWEYQDKLTHYTLVAHAADGKMMVYDGHVRWQGDLLKLRGFAAPMPDRNSWDIHLATQQQVRAMGDGVEKLCSIPASSVVAEMNDGPWKNLFFACYFLLTVVHAVHLIGGIIAAGTLLIMGMRKKVLPAATEYVGIYWHFVDLVWIFLFVILYLS